MQVDLFFLSAFTYNNYCFVASFPQNELIFTDILRLSVAVSVSDVQDGGQQVSVDGAFIVPLHIRYQISSCFIRMFLI